MSEQGQAAAYEQPGVQKKRITVDELKKIWNDKNVIYSDEELTAIRDWLCGLSEVVFDIFDIKKNKTQVIELKATEHEVKKGNTICEGEHRRTGRKRA